jgi:hypothetical protein
MENLLMGIYKLIESAMPEIMDALLIAVGFFLRGWK